MDALFHNIEVLIQGQHVLAFLLVFVAGLISASSPCIIAAIPLIIGYVGGYSNGSRARAALFSAIFVLGLSLTFTLLGAAASTVGQLLGFLGVWLEYGFAALAIIMGLHLLGAITVPLPFQKTHDRNQRLVRSVPSRCPDRIGFDALRHSCSGGHSNLCVDERRSLLWQRSPFCLCHRTLCINICGGTICWYCRKSHIL